MLGVLAGVLGVLGSVLGVLGVSAGELGVNDPGKSIGVSVVLGVLGPEPARASVVCSACISMHAVHECPRVYES